MLNMTPKAILAEGQFAPDKHRYRVLFDRDGKEVAYTFTLTDSDISGVQWDDEEFYDWTKEDSLMPKLMQSILKFHESRQLLVVQK